MKPELEIVASPEAVAERAAELTKELAARAIAQRGRFVLALSGGSTPKIFHQILSGPNYLEAIDWSKVVIVFSDERAVPPDHKDSNFRMAEETLLSKVPAKYHRIDA